jgi:hypothetical protein
MLTAVQGRQTALHDAGAIAAAPACGSQGSVRGGRQRACSARLGCGAQLCIHHVVRRKILQHLSCDASQGGMGCGNPVDHVKQPEALS